MCFTIHLLIVIYSTLDFNYASETFLYEGKHNYGLGNRVIENYRRLNHLFLSRKAYPEPLPTTKRSLNSYIRTPYENIYQGLRRPNDTRVYRKKFDYKAKSSGHRVVCDGLFDCQITHVAVETINGIPIILRGGVGYRFVTVIARANPGEDLKGIVRIYCLNKTDEYHQAKYLRENEDSRTS